jgi:predicted transcriptional regulator
MSNSTSPLGQEGLPSALRETILEIHEKILISQLTAVRKLRSHPGFPDAGSGQGKQKRKGRSQIDLTFDILKSAGTPLHASEIISRVSAAYGVNIDSESLVSALSKRVARKDRFTRTARNTFALL